VPLLTLFELRDAAERSPGLPPVIPWAGAADPPSDPLWQDWQAGRSPSGTTGRAGSRARVETQAFMGQFYEPGGDHLVRQEMWDLVRSFHAGGGRRYPDNDPRLPRPRGWSG
jgi:hypothetical protein